MRIKLLCYSSTVGGEGKPGDVLDCAEDVAALLVKVGAAVYVAQKPAPAPAPEPVKEPEPEIEPPTVREYAFPKGNPKRAKK